MRKECEICIHLSVCKDELENNETELCPYYEIEKPIEENSSECQVHAKVSPQHWGIDIRIDGERVLTIESNGISGIEDIGKYDQIIKEIAQNLLSFIGESG